MSKLLTASVSAIQTAPVTCQPHSTINTPTVEEHPTYTSSSVHMYH